MRIYPDLYSTISEDRCYPQAQTPAPITCFDADMYGLSVEQTAYTLAQLSAVHLLPPLVDLPTGTDLLNYTVNLREKLARDLLRELAQVLAGHGQGCGWVQISQHAYLSVIGAGVAARLDMTPGAEHLDLRIEGQLANELFLAGRTLDLPRSRLFLQTNLYDNFDRLLVPLREHVWHWIAG